MGILNVTPDSFYSSSRKQSEQEIISRIEEIVQEGGDFIDVGAYSSRPDATHISQEEEMERLKKGLTLIQKVAPHIPVSVDTFRAEIARICVEEYGAALINDISAGEMDANMFDTISRLKVPYIMMHMQGTPQNMQQAPHYDHLIQEILVYFSKKKAQLQAAGLKDIIIDPGFGFGKTVQHNYELLHHMDDLHILECPILVGVSRKSMIYKVLNTDPQQALNGTSVLHTIALLKGAHILRVHDVKECTEVIKLIKEYNQCSSISE
jgi:dihydropteroate synthase